MTLDCAHFILTFEPTSKYNFIICIEKKIYFCNLFVEFHCWKYVSLRRLGVSSYDPLWTAAWVEMTGQIVQVFVKKKKKKERKKSEFKSP